LVYFGISDGFADELILPNTNDLWATTHCENIFTPTPTAFLPLLDSRPLWSRIAPFKAFYCAQLQLFNLNYVRTTVTSCRL